MRYSRHRAVVLFALLLSAAPAGAQVRDEGKFFSPQAVERANREIAEIERRHKKQLVIETYPNVPAPYRDALGAGQDRNAVYNQWVAERAQAGKVNGVMGILTQEPRFMRFDVGARTQQEKAFTESDRDALVQRFRQALGSNDSDRALLGAVSFVDATMSQNKGGVVAGTGAPGAQPAQTASGRQPAAAPPAAIPPTAPPARRGFGFGSLLFWGALILLGVFLLRRMFANRRPAVAGGPFGQTGMNQPLPPTDPRYGTQPGGYQQPGQPGYGQPGYGPGGGGGGFGRGVGGGLLGGLAGGYLYDKVFRGGGAGQGGGAAAGGAAPLPPDQQAAGGGFQGDDAGQGFSSNDAGGGGDIGGGDSGGGGDAGGGDF